MKFSAKLSIGAELDVDALVEAEPDEIQRFLHRALFFARHLDLSFSRPARGAPARFRGVLI